MGKDVEQTVFTRADRQRFRQKIRRCLDVFAQMLAESRFQTGPMAGLEIELNLVDDAGDPTMRNAAVLEAIADPAFQTELGQFNIEINLLGLPLHPGDGVVRFACRRVQHYSSSNGSQVQNACRRRQKRSRLTRSPHV